jgi:hypothetical protein
MREREIIRDTWQILCFQNFPGLMAHSVQGDMCGQTSLRQYHMVHYYVCIIQGAFINNEQWQQALKASLNIGWPL